MLAFFFMGLVATSTAASAWIMKDVINEVFIDRDKTKVYAIALAVLVIFAVKGGATYGQMIVMSRIGNNIVASAQRRLFDRITHQSLAFFDRMPLGDLGTRISHNTNAARAALEMVITSIGRDLLTVIGLIAVMVVQDPVMSLIAFVIMPPAIIAVSALVRRVRRIAKSQFVSLSQILSIMQETAIGIRIVKAFSAEEWLRQRMNAAVDDVERQANKIARLTARTSPIMETLGGFAIAGIILYGGYSVIEMGRDPGGFFAFITALLLAYDPAKRLARLNVNLGNSLVGVRLMYDLLDRPIVLGDKAGAHDLPKGPGEVSLKDVRFQYGEAPALNGVSFTARAGNVTALVGPSGAGKSTIFSLLERFYDVASGRIEIDGNDIRDLTLASLRGNLALVSQDTFLFDLSVRENIALGRPGASDAEIVEAARAANAHDFIMAMPEGYETSVGEGGNRLSGGQRQRIAIARAMLKDARILLLDEATSALDSESEAKIQTALERLMQGRTTLVIAHRLSTVRDANRILVFDKGMLVEEGSHHELFARDGLYRRLCDLQFREPDAAA
ncbi:ABC transporter ATP-binding protein [Stappia sp. F7233]|uniref:ABC transporter ATP-binding protein n=1 Tax=Stappia albiluteola TaxID=2758565 RepID=A0A839AC04_9HYPH|nr:ABC transporter ATP-binding protein [Stappia albiluteola]MBA5776696.1 ABC transporter ATP-binding protein [Stappia albiluteola]